TGDLLWAELGQHPVGLGPRFRGGVPADRVQPDAEAQFATCLIRQFAHPGDLRGDRVGRLAPGEVDVDVLGCHWSGGPRRSAEVYGRHRVRRAHHGRALDLEVRAFEVVWLPAPGAADNVEELAGPRVPLVVRKVVTEPALLALFAAG